MVEWTDDQARLGYAEARRKLDQYRRSEAIQEALAN